VTNRAKTSNRKVLLMAVRRSKSKKTPLTKLGRAGMAELLTRNGEILRQLQILQGLPKLNERSSPQEAWAIEDWRKRLMSLMADNAALAANPTNVDTSASDADRVAQMWTVLGSCIDDLDSDSKRQTRGFLLHVGWHEGARLTTRSQIGGGPGRSFFQFEAYRAKEALQYAEQLGVMDKVAAVTSNAVADINAARDALPNYGDQGASNFPDGNLIQDLLLSNDLFGTYLVRIAFRKVPAPIPASNTDQAAYWYQYWKVTGGDPDTLKATFKAEADEVDSLVPPES